jgi:hypothetical protein
MFFWTPFLTLGWILQRAIAQGSLLVFTFCWIRQTIVFPRTESQSTSSLWGIHSFFIDFIAFYDLIKTSTLVILVLFMFMKTTWIFKVSKCSLLLCWNIIIVINREVSKLSIKVTETHQGVGSGVKGHQALMFGQAINPIFPPLYKF